jgi:peptidoglycan-associated lipoprotein
MKPFALPSFAHLVLPAVLVSGLAACGHEAPRAPSAIGDGSTRSVVARVEAAPPPVDPASSVGLSDDIRAACDVHVRGDVQRAPKFDFDDDALSTVDRQELDQVASCLTTGKLAGRSIRLIGRADPRGESEYNLGLGGRRAASVRAYLENAGVPAARIELTSRGALDAHGTDEDGWRMDRRVDVALI